MYVTVFNKHATYARWKIHTDRNPAHGDASERGKEAHHNALALNQHQVTQDQAHSILAPAQSSV